MPCRRVSDFNRAMALKRLPFKVDMHRLTTKPDDVDRLGKNSGFCLSCAFELNADFRLVITLRLPSTGELT